MRQYLDAVKTVLERGTRKPNRTGVDTLSTFNVNYAIDLQEGFPLLTTKKINWKNIVVELLWFLSGRTDIGILKKHKCEFWSAWADPETNEVDSAYGNMWRKFPVHIPRSMKLPDDSFMDVPAVGFNDQLAWVIDTLKRDPMSRRMVVSAWAPENAQTSRLPPCHCLFVVNVQNTRSRQHDFNDGGDYWIDEQRLCLHLTQRSCDIALGVPYNIASYALLMHLLSRFSGIPVGTFGHTLVDAHAYTCKADGSMAEYDHVPGLREQLSREPRPLPRLEIAESIQSLADVEALIEADTDEVMRHFVLHGYEPHEAISFKVAV
jgi:thymidylate synthase